ncbi:unnamed protein product [Orchesella dallaii]|uniref:Erythronolide synthase, modules 3 and 4 n=1 Tax=Orchesella dallaii TaxID=48710 RepID=A0ABP1Q0S8_9HEXA
MTGFSGQIWLTSALTDEDVPNALTLCCSLKRVFTSRKIAVIYSSKVSKNLKEALNYGFDFLFHLEEDWNTTGLKNEEFVKLFPLTLKSFEKCAYLSPNMLVLKNCDELLDQDNENPQQFIWTEKGDTSIFIARPSLQAFHTLMQGLQARNGHSVDHYLRSWITNQTTECRFIEEKYNRLISPQNGMLVGYEKDISIVNLGTTKISGEISNSNGLIIEKIQQLRQHLYEHDVHPILTFKSTVSSTLPTSVTTTSHQSNEPIAIVGMSCRYPSANNLEEFWNILVEAKDGTGNPPDFRWMREQSCGNAKPELRKTNAGFLKVPVDDFDAKFFGISPKEMVCMDPQHRLLHELVWEGLEDAAVNPESLSGTDAGVFIGSWMTDYKDILTHGGHDEFYRMYMGNSIGAAAARISHLLGLTGPSIATESGCSSAMVAVHLACKSLQRGETSFALACGVNLLLHPFDKDVMPMVISPNGHCKTFDAKADGFARGEGCGVLVLKRLTDAVRDGDKVWALIRGSGMTQEGISKSMGTPTVQCESLAMKQALRDANVNPAHVSYVEAHGTGTVVGDPMEVSAIAKAYHSKQRKEPLLIGSVKTNVGHTESCSGITGIMKVVLAMQNEIIPPHRNFETLNPAIDLEAVPAKIPLEAFKWKKEVGVPRLAGVSSFGITGTDAHVILEEAPALPHNILCSSSYKRPLHVMKISAKTEEAMQFLLENYKNHLTTSKEELSDLAYTANIGRADFSQRAIIIAKSKGDAIKSIEQNKLLRGEETKESLGKVCFLFTGQGSQYPGMAKQLYETCPVFKMHFEYCEQILKNNYKIDIAEVLWSPGKKGDISRTIYSQTSIFCVEYALLKLWESWGVKADFALGHSLGEFAAAVCAGILTVEDAIKVVAERSRLIDELQSGKMLVIKADKHKVDQLMKKFAGDDKNKVLDYAAINSSEQTVVAGDSDVVVEFAQLCKEKDLKCIVLEATHAFHSKHMDPMLGDYRNVAKTVSKLGGNSSQYISGMRGILVETDQVDAEYWVQHTREKVLFLNASKKAVELGCKTFIEIGPQPVLAALTMMNNDVQLQCLPSLKKNESEWETLFNTLGKLYVKGFEINWRGLDEFYERKKVSLPHYPFIGKKFWPDLLAVTGSTIHPLIGTVIENASSTKLFQGGLNLRGLEYVKDHAIGDHVIFPGAGYLEMCLAAGLATIEGCTDFLPPPIRPMKVENLIIQAPLLLQDSKTCQVQTVVDFNTSKENELDWNDINIKVFHKVESETTKWLSHAQATFSPLPSAEEKNTPFDTDVFLQTLAQPCNDNSSLTELYDKLASVGLKFGPAFRSIEKLWRDEESKTLLAKVKVPSSEEKSQANYIIHPVVLDAMIQAVMMLCHTATLKRKLYVPIKVGKLVWLCDPDSSCSELYVHAFTSTSEKSDVSTDSAILVDSAGKQLAVMSSVEFIDTTVKAIESVVEQQNTLLPDMWEQVWKPTPNLAENRLSLQLRSGHCHTDGFEKHIDEVYNNPEPHIMETFTRLEEMCYLNFLRALYESGWNPNAYESFSEDGLFYELKLEANIRKYFGFMLTTLEKEGILQKTNNEKDDDTQWKVVRMPPLLSEVLNLLNSPLFTKDLVKAFNPTLLYAKFGENLSQILKGQVSPLSIHFPEEGANWPSVADFYKDYTTTFRLNRFADDICKTRFAHVTAVSRESQTNPEANNYPIKLLEIGAGTGSYTNDFFKALEELGVDFEYTFTDISAAFFPEAQKKFEKHLSKIVFKKLNIEEDPIEQGFIPEYYDYVYMAEVIHATKDIKESLRNIRMLMRPYANLDMLEQTRIHRPISYLFGAFEGFWRFNDFELRPKHCTLSRETWKNVYEETGFEVDGVFSTLEEYHSYVCVHKRPNDSQEYGMLNTVPALKKTKVWLIFNANGHQSQLVGNYLQERIGGVEGRTVISVTEGNEFEDEGNNFKVRGNIEEDFQKLFASVRERQLEVEGIIYGWALPNTNLSQETILQPYFHLVKTVLSFKLNKQPRIMAVTSSTMPVEDNDLSHFHAGTLWAFTKSLKNEHYEINCRCIEIDETPDEKGLQALFYEIWNCDKITQVVYHGATRYVPKLTALKPLNEALKLPKGVDRYQLILPESKTIADLQFGPLELGKLKEEDVEIQIKASALNFRDVLSVLKPSEEFKNINTVGLDLAGVVKRVGEKVTKWKVGDRVSGCNVHLNALPSHLKLHQDLLIGLSQNTTFCEAATIPAVYVTSIVCLLDIAKIRKEDVVLIHTAAGGVGLSAIEICKHVGCTIIATAGGKRKQNYLRSLGIQHIFHSRNTQYGDQILELTNGRGVNVVLNSLTSEGFKETTLKACAKNARFVEMSKLNIWTPDEVKRLRPDVDYRIVDISAGDNNDWCRYMEQVGGFLETGIVKPIPYVRFDAQNVREALQYMQKAKHIGKIVCVMPELRNECGDIQVFTPMFNDNSTYLITGGLGGIGFVVCLWMIEMGAKHLVLAGRSLPSSTVQHKINDLNSNGANVIPVQLDVANLEECEKLIKIKMGEMRLPPLRGVMHAAGTLSDGLISNQEWTKLSSTFTTKIQGTLNLHELTKHLNLEHFVVFSSMAALIGTPGQCNHTAGNMFQDNFIHYRNSIGLPGTSVNWGQWGEVGVATEIDVPGVNPISNLQGVKALQYALKSQRTQTAACNMKSFVMLSKLNPTLSTYLDERIWTKHSAGGSITLKSDEFWERYDSKSEIEERTNVIKEQLKSILRSILKLDDADKVDNNADFQEMGVDSLMFVEIKNSLQSMLGDRLSVNASTLKDCSNINVLADTLVGLIEGAQAGANIKPTIEEVNALIREDSQLPEHIKAKEGQKTVDVKDITRVLLTGSTGTLGPYIIERLTNSAQISQVVCLIRPTKKYSVEERLHKILDEKALLTKIKMRKVRCVTGNVALKHLGLNSDVWEELSESIDAIVHCAAHVEHTEYYRKKDSTKDTRAVNTGGTKNLLEFACERKLKHVFQASSLIYVSNVDDQGRILETWPDVGEFDGITPFAYPISKHVGDCLLKEALNRGIPCKSVRLPLIVGESNTGRCSAEGNHELMRYMFILKNGMTPSLPVAAPMLPVDICADVSTQIFLNPSAPSDVYNVLHSKPDLEQEFVEVAKKLGYKVEIVEFSEFSKKMQESLAISDSSMGLFAELYKDEDTFMGPTMNSPIIKQWLEGNEEVFMSNKIPRFIPNFYESQRPTMEYVYKDLLFIKEQGWFEKFGLHETIFTENKLENGK